MEAHQNGGNLSFKLDLVTYSDVAALLPLPNATPVTTTPLVAFQELSALDQRLAANPALVQQLTALLTAADVSSIYPTSASIASVARPSSAIAQQVLQCNPDLFQYAVADAPHLHGTLTAATVSADRAAPPSAGPAAPSVRKDKKRAAISAGGEPKRARRASLEQEQVYVEQGPGPEATAAKLRAHIEQVLAGAAQAARQHEEDDDGQMDGGDDCSPAPLQHRFSQQALKQLHDELLRAKAHGYLQLLPTALLQQLVRALHAQGGLGANRLLLDDAEPEDFQAAFALVTTSLQSAVDVLCLLSAPGLPPELYLEEVMERAVGLLKYHLQYNGLACNDVRFRRLYRPASIDEDEDAPKGSKTPRAKASKTSTQQPKWLSQVVGQLELGLQALSGVLGVVRMSPEGLIPLVRMALQSLTVDSMQAFHVKAAGLAVAMFRYYPQQRSSLLEELTTGVLSYVQPGKQVSRHYLAQGVDRTVAVQAVVALVAQLVQVTAELPAFDAGVNATFSCYNTPLLWADKFWQAVFARLPTARTTKSDTSVDLKAWLEAFTEDLLALVVLPEWPAASLLLRRLILTINGEAGMKHADSGVRLAAVDLLGLLAGRLCGLVKEAEAEAAEAQALVSTALTASGTTLEVAACDQAEIVQQLLLEHLALDAAGGAPPAAASTDGAAGLTSIGLASTARQLMVCGMVVQNLKVLKQLQGDELSDDDASAAVVQYRQLYDRQRSCLGASVSDLPDVSRSNAVVLGRWLVADSLLGRSRPTLLKWLAEAGGRARQDVANAAAVRSKAIKLLGAAIDVDVRVLMMPEVQEGVQGALLDDSVMVREAALELIGKYMSRNQELAVQYYDVITKATEDTGVTVRKRAVKLLWECCVRGGADFPHRADAIVRIMTRAGDQEEAMRVLVVKICSEIWFLSKITLDDESSQVSHHTRTAQERARQLAEVCSALYARLGPGINVPLPASSSVVVALKAALGSGAEEVAEALMARALELQDAPSDDGAAAVAEELFQCLLALHALCTADVRLVVGGRDQQKVVRCLAPYLKEVPPSTSDLAARRKAEQLLCIMAIIDAALGHLRHLEDALADEMAADLHSLILRLPHVSAVGVAIQCLCSLARLKPSHQETVRKQAILYYNALDGDYLRKITASSKQRKLYPRFLFTVGQLCRCGAAILDDKAEGAKHPTCSDVLQLLLNFYSLQDSDLRTKEVALQAMGFVFIARPDLSVDVAAVREVLSAALSNGSPLPLKARCLASLAELLQAEEDHMLARQKKTHKEAACAQQASTMPAAEAKGLARRNGEGDTGSVSSGLLQMLWSKVLSLAKDTSPAGPTMPGNTPPPTPSGGPGTSASVRRRALDLIEVVVRGGIVVPWSAIPALMALATDPEREIAARGLAVLRGVVANNTQYAAGQVPTGIAEAYCFHRSLCQAGRHPDVVMSPESSRALLESLGAVWLSVFQPDKALKVKFLGAIMKPFDDASCLASGSAAKSDPHQLLFLSYVVAELPYRKMDELLAVMARINETLSRRAAGILNRFQELRQQEGAKVKEEPLPAAAAADGHTSTSGASEPGRAPPAAQQKKALSAKDVAFGLAATVKAAVAVSMLLLIKCYLRLAYDVAAERLAKYDPSGPQRKQEEKLNCVHNGKHRFSAVKLKVDLAARMGAAAAGAQQLSAHDKEVAEVYTVLKQLMKQDEADYRRADDADGPQADGPNGADKLQAAEGEETGGLDAAAMMAMPAGASKPPKARAAKGGTKVTSRGGGGRGETAGRGRGRGRGRKRAAAGSDDDEGDDGDDEDFKPATKAKRRLDADL